MERGMGRESANGLMGQLMKESGRMTRDMALGLSLAWMDTNTLDRGPMTSLMALELSLQGISHSHRPHGSMDREMDLECILTKAWHFSELNTRKA